MEKILWLTRCCLFIGLRGMCVRWRTVYKGWRDSSQNAERNDSLSLLFFISHSRNEWFIEFVIFHCFIVSFSSSPYIRYLWKIEKCPFRAFLTLYLTFHEFSVGVGRDWAGGLGTDAKTKTKAAKPESSQSQRLFQKFHSSFLPSFFFFFFSLAARGYKGYIYYNIK
jgi:hypothetical protein